MSSDEHVFLQLEISELREDARERIKNAEMSGIARYYESLVKLLDQLGTFVKPGQFCKKDHWIAIEKRIAEAAQRDACGAHADVQSIAKTLSAAA